MLIDIVLAHVQEQQKWFAVYITDIQVISDIVFKIIASLVANLRQYVAFPVRKSSEPWPTVTDKYHPLKSENNQI